MILSNGITVDVEDGGRVTLDVPDGQAVLELKDLAELCGALMGAADGAGYRRGMAETRKIYERTAPVRVAEAAADD